jgi:tryptophan synthase beta subunit
VIGVGAHAVADNLGQNLCSARLGKLQILKDEDAGALADDEAVAVLVKGAAGAGGLGVAMMGGVKRASGYFAVFGWWVIGVLLNVGIAAAFS